MVCVAAEWRHFYVIYSDISQLVSLIFYLVLHTIYCVDCDPQNFQLKQIT